MRSFRLVGFLVALAFFLPACGNSSPTDIPGPVFELGEGECESQEECSAFGGLIGSGG